jgi:hypothetical protein
MTFAFKLSRRLAQGFWVAGALTLAGCVGELTDPIDSTNPVSTISITPSTANVAVNSTVQLYATLRDSTGAALGGRLIAWTSDAAGVATVSTAGVVRGEAAGSATIWAASEGKSTSAVVTVSVGGGGGGSPRAGYYVSPTGSSGADGSYANPWDLPTGLSGAGGRVQPGDTVWMLGGTYRGNFRSTLTGTASAWVVVRAYPGERAIVDGATGSETASTWYVGGQYSAFWGIEITNSNPARILSLSGRRQNVVANYASHTKYINMVVHNGGVGFYNEFNFVDVEIVGCIIYNSGWQGPDRGHGHALYLKSDVGPVVARDNVMFNQFGYGVHIFSNPGSGQLNNIRLEGNVSFNNGTQSTNSTAANILFGGDDYSTGGVLRDNLTYSSPGVAGNNVHVGYGTLKNGTVQLSGNYIAGAGTVLDVGYWNSVSATSNLLMGTGTLVTLRDPTLPLTLFSGQTQTTMPTTTKIVVRKNPYETGRANIVVYNWSHHGSVNIDLSGVLPMGAQYEIRNVQNLFGAPVVSGTYGGGSINLPIDAVPAPAPTGMSSARSPSTGTDFGVYVVTIRS